MRAQDIGIDLIAYDREGNIVLLAETKSMPGTSKRWAAELRRNMLAHGALPQAKYFLIATPERIYVWKQDMKQEAASGETIFPEFTIDAAQELQPYFEKFQQKPSEIGPEEFTLLVSSWLTNLAWAGEERGKLSSSIAWLRDSGLQESLRGARVEMALG
ncbi:MAG: hypothetical protein JOZ32_01340 [Bryobacterales bacterium]|nr:hypothetical protein [Bryobacterales bacterium]